MVAQKRGIITTGSAAYKESLRTIILRILAEGPNHGYNIMKEIERITEGRWRPAAGTIYPLLETMLNEGLIKVSSVIESGVRGGKRVLYELTEKGWRELADILLLKSKSKMKIVEWMMVEGAVLLRSKGLTREADEICRTLRRTCRELAGSLENNC